MEDRNNWDREVSELHDRHGFTMGYKLLYCPWRTLNAAKVAFVSLNPGRPPDNVELGCISDERGNSYEVEQFTTRSPITKQFLMLADFLKLSPSEILTGVAVPFRSNSWADMTEEQRRIGAHIGLKFWGKVLQSPQLQLIVLNAGEVSDAFLQIAGAKLIREIPSGWGGIALKQHQTARGARIVQLPQLSRFKLFSRADCLGPLRQVFFET